MFNRYLLQGKIALVTGASRGIGHGIALALGREDAFVIGTATSEQGANAITETFKKEGIKGKGMILNVRDTLSIQNLMSELKKDSNKISILINNAAVTQDNLILRMKEEEWMTVLETDLSSVYHLTKACIREMIKARWGRIINIGSVVGSVGNPGQANYCAAKAGVIGFSKALALEVGSREITVNTVSPGFIATDMTNVLTNEQREAIIERIPVQRIGKIEDIAAAVVFLASDLSNYITGQTLHVNGGMYMN